jgi:hypothetical protein
LSPLFVLVAVGGSIALTVDLAQARRWRRRSGIRLLTVVRSRRHPDRRGRACPAEDAAVAVPTWSLLAGITLIAAGVLLARPRGRRAA